MHFYTYNDWMSHSYTTTNEKDLSKGQTKILMSRIESDGLMINSRE